MLGDPVPGVTEPVGRTPEIDRIAERVPGAHPLRDRGLVEDAELEWGHWRGGCPADQTPPAGLSAAFLGWRDADVLRPLAADRVVEQFEHHLVANLEIEELPLEVGLVEENVTIGGADHPARLSAGQTLDPAGGFFASVDRAGRHPAGRGRR